jgi:hypothetical protein
MNSEYYCFARNGWKFELLAVYAVKTVEARNVCGAHKAVQANTPLEEK